MRTLIVVLAVLCFIPAWASEPGQPLDCSDWVFLEPGFSCTIEVPLKCDAAPECNRGSVLALGRQSSGGVLTGRDPAVLPGCVE